MKTVMRKEKAVREKSLQTRKLTSRSLMMKDLLSNTMERSKALMMINLKKTMLMTDEEGGSESGDLLKKLIENLGGNPALQN